MPDVLMIQISGDSSKLISELKKSGVAVKEFDDAGQKGAKGAKSFGDELGNLAGQLGFGFGLATIVQGTLSFGKEAFLAAAQAERLGEATDSLGKRFNTTGDEIIKSIQEASGYTISRMDAMLAANKAMTFGVVKNKDEFAKLAEMAIVLGRSMGQSATKSLEDLTVALGRGSPLILDNLGLIIGMEDETRKYAETVGKSVMALTDQERSQIFINAALREGGEIVGELGGVAEDTMSQVERFDAAWADFTATYGEQIAPALSGLLGGMADLIRFGEENIEVINVLLGVLNPAYGAFNLLGGATEETAEAQEKLAETTQISTEELAKQQEEAKVLDEAMREIRQSTADYYLDATELQDEYAKSVQDGNMDIVKANSDMQASVAENTQTFNDKMDELDNERIEAKNDLRARGAEMTDAEYEAEAIKIDKHYESMVQKTKDKYNSENAEIQTKLHERQLAIEQQQAEEKAAFEENIRDLKLKTILGIAETNGELDKLTGGITDKASVAFDLIKAGLIPVNSDLTKALAEGSTKLTTGFADAKGVAQTNLRDIDNAFSNTETVLKDLETQALKTATAVGNVGSFNPSGLGSGPGYATGGTFTVPPGYPNDSYNMRVSSGETVTVQNNYNLTTQTALDSAGVSRDFQFMQMFA